MSELKEQIFNKKCSKEEQSDAASVFLPVKTLSNSCFSWCKFVLPDPLPTCSMSEQYDTYLSKELSKENKLKDTFENDFNLPSCLAYNLLRLYKSLFDHEWAQKIKKSTDFSLSRQTALLLNKAFFFTNDVNTKNLKLFNVHEDLSTANNNEEILTPLQKKDPSGTFYITKIPGFFKTDKNRFKLWSQFVNEQDTLRVYFFGSSGNLTHLYWEKFFFFRLDTIQTALKHLCFCLPKESNQKLACLSSLSLAQYCPTLFWNLVLQLDSDCFQIQQFLSPFFRGGLSSKTLRQRPCSKQSNSTKYQKERYRINNHFTSPVKKKKSSQLRLSLNPTVDEKYYVFNKLHELTRKRLSLWKAFPDRMSSYQQATMEMSLLPEINHTSHHFLRNRNKTHLQKDPLALLNRYLDPNGFPKYNLEELSLSSRLILYCFSCLNQWTAPLDLRFNEKGRAVYAMKPLKKYDFICEYAGEFLSSKFDIQQREKLYSTLPTGCFMFYFKDPSNGKMACIDATLEKVEYGLARFINHSHIRPNCFAMVIPANTLGMSTHPMKNPRLAFISKQNITANEEILIDYGERNVTVLKMNPWLLKT